MVTHPFTQWRPDGWPLCPHCGKDELWSDFWWDGTGVKPPVQRYIDAGLTCYRCGWQSAGLPSQESISTRTPTLQTVLTTTATTLHQCHAMLLDAFMAHDAALTPQERRTGVRALEALARAFVLLGRLGASETGDEG
jgi:hypothetical protein